jgi:hypothetical protein
MLISTHPLGSSGRNGRSFRKSNEERADGFEVEDRVGLGGEISEIEFSGSPFGLEVPLSNSVLDPVIAHVNGFAAADFGGAISDATGGFIIISESSSSLRMAEIPKSLAIDFGILGIHEEGGIGRFSGRANYGGDDRARGANGAVDIVGFVSTVEDDGAAGRETGAAGAALTFAVVRLVGVDV